MFRYIAWLAVATSAFAQQALVPSLIEYLDLTAAQITRLRQSAADYHRFYAEKQARYEQVSRELAAAYTREVVDPLSLGQAYVEQEAICRELRAAYQQNFERNQTVLTVPQRTRLSALDGVVANARLASSAAANNLIEGASPSGGISSLLSGLGILTGLPAGLRLPSGICGVPHVASNPTLLSRERAKEVK